MTSQSPRIYLYKITFEEVPYYYYGIKKEKYFNQQYWGSPITHKWMWDFYTPKKQILQFFDFTDGGYIEAQEIEKRIITPVLNDKWCLNENVGGSISVNLCVEGGKKAYELGLGVHKRSKEKMREDGKNGAKKCYELGVGIFGLTKEQILENCKKAGEKCYQQGKGVFSLTNQEKKKNGVLGGTKSYECKLGYHQRTKEQMTEDGKKGGKIGSKITNSQKWECRETGYVSTAAGVFLYQKARGIDTSKNNRRKIA